ncbi:hypothetical protein NODU109028_00225 [Nocardioides dubius]|uniref:Uncharacterized protein n=1 Tax=Nocardioides dubius TaxID=317019 RepID=A0ABN1U0A4_9ACTN
MSDQASQALTLSDAQAWLSTPRLQGYLGASHHDLALALALYRWNSVTTGAALAEVGHLEVALRNAYDREL